MSKSFATSVTSSSVTERNSNFPESLGEIYRRTELSPAEKERLFELWNSEFPNSIGYKECSDFENKFIRNLLSPRYLLLRNNHSQKILGFYIDFLRGNDRWFVMLLDQKHQGRGFGSLLLEHAQTDTDSLSGWVIERDTYFKGDGENYRSPVEFYKKNGFDVVDDIKSSRNGIETVKIVWRNQTVR